MHNLKYYVLTSSNLDSLKRHTSPEYSNIPKDRVVVIINTMDIVYAEEASAYCQESGIEYYVTESNGTPGRGKNSVLEKFLESDNDYCVQIDGDDYLTPHGVYMYDNLSKTDNPPDVICLTHQVSVTYDRNDINEYIQRTGLIPARSDIKPKPAYCFRIDYDKTINNINDKSNDISEEIREIREIVVAYHELQRKYSEESEIHCRITWYSRKAAVHRFDEDIYIGEDTLHYFKLKNEHVESRLTFMNNVEIPPTYIYDKRNEETGTVFKYSKGGADAAWLGTYMSRAYEYEKQGILHNNKVHQLPLLKIDYPADYIPQLSLPAGHETTGNAVYNITDKEDNKYTIEHPANATQECILAKYQAEYNGKDTSQKA